MATMRSSWAPTASRGGIPALTMEEHLKLSGGRKPTSKTNRRRHKSSQVVHTTGPGGSPRPKTLGPRSRQRLRKFGTTRPAGLHPDIEYDRDPFSGRVRFVFRGAATTDRSVAERWQQEWSVAHRTEPARRPPPAWALLSAASVPTAPAPFRRVGGSGGGARDRGSPATKPRPRARSRSARRKRSPSRGFHDAHAALDNALRHSSLQYQAADPSGASLAGSAVSVGTSAAGSTGWPQTHESSVRGRHVGVCFVWQVGPTCRDVQAGYPAPAESWTTTLAQAPASSLGALIQRLAMANQQVVGTAPVTSPPLVRAGSSRRRWPWWLLTVQLLRVRPQTSTDEPQPFGVTASPGLSALGGAASSPMSNERGQRYDRLEVADLQGSPSPHRESANGHGRGDRHGDSDGHGDGHGDSDGSGNGPAHGDPQGDQRSGSPPGANEASLHDRIQSVLAAADNADVPRSPSASDLPAVRAAFAAEEATPPAAQVIAADDAGGQPQDEDDSASRDVGAGDQAPAGAGMSTDNAVTVAALNGEGGAFSAPPRVVVGEAANPSGGDDAQGHPDDDRDTASSGGSPQLSFDGEAEFGQVLSSPQSDEGIEGGDEALPASSPGENGEDAQDAGPHDSAGGGDSHGDGANDDGELMMPLSEVEARETQMTQEFQSQLDTLGALYEQSKSESDAAVAAATARADKAEAEVGGRGAVLPTASPFPHLVSPAFPASTPGAARREAEHRHGVAAST